MQVHPGKIEIVISLLEAQGGLDFVGFSRAYLGRLESRFEELWHAREAVVEPTRAKAFVRRLSVSIRHSPIRSLQRSPLKEERTPVDTILQNMMPRQTDS